MLKALSVFCGSSLGVSPAYSEAADDLADLMCEMGVTLVYGGANIGLMGHIANRMLKNSGKVIGVITTDLESREISHQELTELHVVSSMHERKSLLYKLAHGFIMLPGGPGSFEEFFEIFTWRKLGYHSKPCGILNTNGYYDHLLKFLDHVSDQGFLKKADRQLIIEHHSVQDLMQRMRSHYNDAH